MRERSRPRSNGDRSRWRSSCRDEGNSSGRWPPCEPDRRRGCRRSRQPAGRARMARQQDGDRSLVADPVLPRRVSKQSPVWPQLPVAHFPALPPDGCIFRPRVGVYGAGIQPRRADGCVEITFVSRSLRMFRAVPWALCTVAKSLMKRASPQTPRNRPRLTTSVFGHTPVGAAECCVEIFPFAQDTVGDQQPVKRGGAGPRGR